MWWPASRSRSGSAGIDGSQTAPCRIAPRPVRQKYWPESSELRHGVHDGALTCALRNSTPLRASRSKCGVRTTSLIPPRPSTSARIPAQRPQSSANTTTMLVSPAPRAATPQTNRTTAGTARNQRGAFIMESRGQRAAECPTVPRPGRQGKRFPPLPRRAGTCLRRSPLANPRLWALVVPAPARPGPGRTRRPLSPARRKSPSPSPCPERASSGPTRPASNCRPTATRGPSPAPAAIRHERPTAPVDPRTPPPPRRHRHPPGRPSPARRIVAGGAEPAPRSDDG